MKLFKKIVLLTSYTLFFLFFLFFYEKQFVKYSPDGADILPPDGSGPKGKGDKGESRTKWLLECGCVLLKNNYLMDM